MFTTSPTAVPDSRAIPPVHAALVPSASPVRADDEPPPAGCGWFDSSLELQRGLAVVEHAGFDAIRDAAPLAWQLGAWL